MDDFDLGCLMDLFGDLVFYTVLEILIRLIVWIFSGIWWVVALPYRMATGQLKPAPTMSKRIYSRPMTSSGRKRSSFGRRDDQS